MTADGWASACGVVVELAFAAHFSLRRAERAQRVMMGSSLLRGHKQRAILCVYYKIFILIEITLGARRGRACARPVRTHIYTRKTVCVRWAHTYAHQPRVEQTERTHAGSENPPDKRSPRARLQTICNYDALLMDSRCWRHTHTDTQACVAIATITIVQPVYTSHNGRRPA